MTRSWCNRMHQLARHVQEWQMLQLPRWLVAFVAAVVAADAAAIGFAASHTAWHLGDVALFAGLIACGAATVWITRRAGETALFTKDVFAVWELPIAILLSPVYALLVPIPRIVLTQCFARKIAPHRRVFTAAVLGLSYGSVSLVFGKLREHLAISPTRSASAAALWILAVCACCLIQWIVNHSLIMVAVKGSDRSTSVLTMLFGRETALNDLTELCVAVVVTLGIAITPVVIVFALPFVTLLQRSVLHSHLVNASRVDFKTGLLNAETWRRESSAELARAQRSGSEVALALIDIDHFKEVNDSYGHLVGDEVLRTLGRSLQLLVREYDLVGRFGGEEFALLLPQTGAVSAHRIAERIRAHIAELSIEPASAPGADPISVTVSIGVAVLGRGDEQVTELLAAADAALYRAKRGGRNRVWMTTDSTSFSATRELGRAANL
jgi:diguanylate cyclase (GGDEF)-like protein